MAQDMSFARGLARLMTCGVVWFELGLFAVLRAVIEGMRSVGRLMHVEEKRLVCDLGLLQSLGYMVILFISVKICAAIYSEMGRFLQRIVNFIEPDCAFWHTVFSRLNIVNEFSRCCLLSDHDYCLALSKMQTRSSLFPTDRSY